MSLRGATGTVKIEGESYTLGEQIQYTDIWANDNYLQFMYERLLLLKELLAEDGTIYVHSDSHRTHHLRCLLDEVFGSENFKNDIIWQRFNYRADGLKFGTVHDSILFYSKSGSYTFTKPYVSLKPSYIKSHFKPDSDGLLYRLDNLTAPSHGKVGKPLRFGTRLIPPPPGTMWRHDQEGIDDLWSKNLIEIPDEGVPQVKRYLHEIEGQAVHSVWTDLSSINSQSAERTEYPTQKPEILLQRVIEASSRPNDLVLDCFIGSGTTAAVAQRLGRRWIGCDINKGAIQTTAKRLQTIIEEQAKKVDEGRGKPRLPGMEAESGDGDLQAAQLSFTVWRVNDYDLTIQHNEAVNLACEHIGIQRTRSDSYFDGTLGNSPVKIIPFGHPLTPLDLEELKRELESRPEEDRPITVVCLGMELAAKAWIEDWNRLRKRKEDEFLHKAEVNKITVIELRTDSKYGHFFEHKPATARVRVVRTEGEDGSPQIDVEIEEFISPTIIKRLGQQSSYLQPQIDDWRAMVDCVMIDPAYNGRVFNVVLADVPEKKSDLVQGKYTLADPTAETAVAVKIIDMLGEEVLVTEQLPA